jgi:hypothetical protein
MFFLKIGIAGTYTLLFLPKSVILGYGVLKKMQVYHIL